MKKQYYAMGMKARFILFLFLLCCFFLKAQTAADYADIAFKATQAGNYDEGAKYYSKAYEADTNYTDYLLYRAWCYYHIGDFTSASADFEHGLVVKSNVVDIYDEVADYYDKIKNYTRAFAVIEEGFLQFPSDTKERAALFARRAGLKTQTKDFEGADADGREAYRIDNKSDAGPYAVANNYDEWGKLEDALLWYNTALQNGGNYAQITNNIVVILNRQLNYETAIEQCEGVLELGKYGDEEINSKTKAFLYNNKSFAEFKLGNLKKAFNDVDKSIKLYPGNSYAYKNRALYYIEKKNIKSACEDLQQAKNLGFKAMYGNDVDDLIQQYCK